MFGVVSLDIRESLRLRMMALSVLVAALGASAAAVKATATPPPNVLIVLTDDQGWGDTGYNCGQPVRMLCCTRRCRDVLPAYSLQCGPVAGQRRLLQAQRHCVPTDATHRRACNGSTLCAVPPLLLGRWRLQPDSGERADRAEQQAQLHQLRAAMRPHGHRGRRLLAGTWTSQD
eukprot:COSAG02_NODE_3190_length_7200_cov_5.803408_4_plen_174_part_00